MLHLIDRRIRVSAVTLAAFFCCSGYIVGVPVTVGVPLVANQVPENEWETSILDSSEYSELFNECWLEQWVRNEHELVIPVAAEFRAEAESRLQQAAALELNVDEAARFIAYPYANEGEESLASQLLANSIASLETRRRDALDRREGSWSGFDQQMLDRIRSYHSDASGQLRPYLIRAVGKAGPLAEAEERFDLKGCRGVVEVRYTSPQAVERPAERRPIIAFLNQMPTVVAVTRWENGPFRKDVMALDLDVIRWGMTLAEVDALLPGLAFAPKYDGPSRDSWGPPWIAEGRYHYAGCEFALTATFASNQLYSVRLNSLGETNLCRDRIAEELAARYGPTKYTIGAGALPLRVWRGRETHATYAYDGAMEIRFISPWFEIHFRQLEIMKQCSVIATVLESEGPIDVTGATLPEPHVYLGCDSYPAISLRLGENGAVRLLASAGADGAVTGVEIVGPSEHQRLNAAAERIARQSLSFNAGTRNGRAVETVVPVELYFYLPGRFPGSGPL